MPSIRIQLAMALRKYFLLRETTNEEFETCMFLLQHVIHEINEKFAYMLNIYEAKMKELPDDEYSALVTALCRTNAFKLKNRIGLLSYPNSITKAKFASIAYQVIQSLSQIPENYRDIQMLLTK